MDYNKIGKKIREIKEKELKQTREEFAEKLGISIHTAARLENATSKVTNIETFIKISEISGYTLDELLLDRDYKKEEIRMKRKIGYMLNAISKHELEYIYENIKQFVHFCHKN